ncbi:MAG TPA: hypothetical protein VED40_22555 [Azospirillaceae bacterium]|nr:hypothetical protein [Azospirillaceae bacterium]
MQSSSPAFISLRTASAEDWANIAAGERKSLAEGNAGAGLLRLLELQRDDDRQGWPINLYDHCLQSASRALRAGADDELVFLALFHDATEMLSPLDHGASAAALLGPYLSPNRIWLLRHHPVFQLQHMVHKPDADRQAFERYRGHPAFEETIRFCALFDENAFDPGYESLPLDAFEGLVDRVCRAALVRS